MIPFRNWVNFQLLVLKPLIEVYHNCTNCTGNEPDNPNQFYKVFRRRMVNIVNVAKNYARNMFKKIGDFNFGGEDGPMTENPHPERECYSLDQMNIPSPTEVNEPRLTQYIYPTNCMIDEGIQLKCTYLLKRRMGGWVNPDYYTWIWGPLPIDSLRYQMRRVLQKHRRLYEYKLRRKIYKWYKVQMEDFYPIWDQFKMFAAKGCHDCPVDEEILNNSLTESDPGFVPPEDYSLAARKRSEKRYTAAMKEVEKIEKKNGNKNFKAFF